MKRILFLLVGAVLLASCGAGRLNTDMSSHAGLVAESRAEGSIVLSMDTIFKAGVPYGIVKVKPANMFQDDLIVYSLNGNEVINIVQSSPKKGDKTWQEYKFLDASANGSAFIEYAMSKMTVVDRIVESDLLNPNGLNSENASRFILRWPDPDNRPKAPEANRMVSRDRTRNIEDNFTEKKITQGGVVIGTYTTSRANVNGTDFTTATIYYMDGTICAVAKFKTFASNFTEVTTTKDNQTHTIDGSYANRSNIQQAAAWLVEKLYL
jgi:hypothetical protein